MDRFRSRRTLVISNGSESLTVALCPERWERFANSNFFVMRDGIDSLPFHMTKKQRSEERQERFALGHKKGGKQ